jgi:glycosyltransferase involved in cell wall biosynthesis
MSRRGQPTLISVVMPVRNGEAHLADQLAALAAQTHTGPWEVVLVDNLCTDRSIEIAEGWRERLPEMVVVDARDRPGLNHARNAGAAAARGDLLAFCDADDVTSPEWLERLAEAAPHADLVGGSIELKTLNDRVRQAWHPTDPLTSLVPSYDFLPYPRGGNCAVWADVARRVRWDGSFAFGSSDIDFGWRAQLAGYSVGFAPEAQVSVRFRTGLRATAKQYFRYGMSEPRLFRRHRRSGMQRDLRAAGHDWWWLARSAPLLRSELGRGRWVRVAASRSGRLWGSLRWRVLYP